MNVFLVAITRLCTAPALGLLLINSVAFGQSGKDEPGGGVLKQIVEIPLPGPAVRFDYQSLDAKNGRLYIAHMNADQLVVFDVQKRQVDAQTNKLIASIQLGGGACNTACDAGSGHILVALHGANELVAINPAQLKIIGRYKLLGIENPHGIALDQTNRLAFIAGEENHSLAVFDLNSMKLLSVFQVGNDPDVLAFDPGLSRLYVSAESGTVTVLEESNRTLHMLGQFHMPHAHTVSVDPKTHLVYFPLENVAGKPLLRIMELAKLH